MNFKVIKKITTLFVVIFVFAACDDDFSTIGGEIINNPAGVNVQEVEVNAYTQKLDALQSNGLANNLLGVYNDPVYGQSQASVLTQLSLAPVDPTFEGDVQLDSVVMNIPYFSTEVQADDTGAKTYKLDSIYGQAPFKLSVYQSDYYLASYDPETDFQNRQKYYSNQQDVFEQHLVGEPLYENDNFIPSPSAIVSYEPKDTGEQDTVVLTPALHVKLPVEFFQQKIIDKEGSSALLNNSNFQEYLRGLFLKAEPVNGDGSMMLLNMLDANAGITLYYTTETETTNDAGDTETTTKYGSYKLKFGSNIVNTFQGEFPDDILQDIQSNDPATGSKRLYLKGGEGSMAVIDLFSEEGQLEELRNHNWLINDADLEIYVDQDKVQGANEPERLYLYDLNNNTILADYSFSANFIGDNNPSDPLNSLTNFSKRLERDTDGNGVKYTIRLTQHISNILKKDSTNVKLGLVVTQNINKTGMVSVRNAEGQAVKQVPTMSVLTPEGTVLYGDEAENEDKRLKLRIYYTDLDQN